MAIARSMVFGPGDAWARSGGTGVRSREESRLGCEIALENLPERVRMADRIVLPGVGAFGDAMRELNVRGLPDVIRTYVTTGKPLQKKDARQLLTKVAEGTWVCGDPGLQYDGPIQKWHTAKGTEPIHSTNPCSEYVFLNNTACNLASLALSRLSARFRSVMSRTIA